MKLARPDVFHPRLVLAGTPRHRGDAGLVAALRARGLHARWVPWDDPATVGADLVILRTSAGDPARRDDFLAWTRRLRHLLNPPDAIAWNLDERYLADLEDDGVPTLPGGTAESALVFLAGEQSHAWPGEPDFEVWDRGSAALASAAARAGIDAGELLYARVDVREDRVVSLDLVGPSLGWTFLDADTRDGAQRRFALGVESARERFGLGPFSHRRP